MGRDGTFLSPDFRRSIAKSSRSSFSTVLALKRYSPAMSTPRPLLQIEGALVFLAAILFYRHLHASWLLFAVLILAPDLFMLGYLAGARIGAACYNFVHTYLTPAALIVIGLLTAKPLLLGLATIWICHIGFDRMLGFGLKYPTRFSDTHLQHV